ncbi:MAG: ATP-dependent DNA helicase, partial [Rhodospirillales bacterium]
MPSVPSFTSAIEIPDAPALIAGVREAVWLSADGEVETVSLKEAASRARKAPPLVCHAKATLRRLKAKPFPVYDVLELFAFVRPAEFCLPTPRGLAEALGLPLPRNRESEAQALIAAATALLIEQADPERPAARSTELIALAMRRGGWLWGDCVLAALGNDAGLSSAGTSPGERRYTEGLKVWTGLKEWHERSAGGPLGSLPVEAVEARARLVQLLGAVAEERPEQKQYAELAAEAFAPPEHEGEPAFVVAEAGTGIGKTLGYIAPASVWAQKNNGTVWLSTYTRNLQRQLDQELDRLYPDPLDKQRKVVIRKGRENYFCLLNFEEAIARLGTLTDTNAITLGLMARWAQASRDGDMIGGDFPAWLADLLGRNLTLDLTDTRGECIYAACAHYRKCFIEKSVRRAKGAEIVVANHALVMINAAQEAVLNAPGSKNDLERMMPTRYVFDEAHHLFDAADSAFAAHLTGLETAELRRWLLGVEEGGRSASRMRGLKLRIDDLIAGNERARDALDHALHAARVLPATGWHNRLRESLPNGAAEQFFAAVRRQVYARDPDSTSAYSLEAPTRPLVEGLFEAASEFAQALSRLAGPLITLSGVLSELLDAEADTLDTSSRQRIEAVVRGLVRRGGVTLHSWRDMLTALGEETPPVFVDWFSVERIQGRDIDVGLHRHWVDPMKPFADVVAKPAHGVLVTSASLRDMTGDSEHDWAAAEARTGAVHLPMPAIRARVPSPFDYARQTRVLVVNDLGRDDMDRVAAAYRSLFLAAGGGGLGLFTAIARLREVHRRIAAAIEAAGLTLLAQHVDGLGTGTLVDIFRAEEDACLLGTDAVRDGIDVPGRALRLIVFDRVPWPRPDILHKARRAAFAGPAYDDMLTRLRLKQAYGRLVRRADDCGVFVLLDRGFPSRLAGAFPDGVAGRRVGLAEAVAETKAFL